MKKIEGIMWTMVVLVGLAVLLVCYLMLKMHMTGNEVANDDEKLAMYYAQYTYGEGVEVSEVEANLDASDVWGELGTLEFVITESDGHRHYAEISKEWWISVARKCG